MNYLIDYKGAYARCMHIPHNQRFKILLRMKLLSISLLFFIVQATASVRSQTLTLRFNNASLEKVLTEIKKQTGYSYIANAKLLKQAKTVTLNVRNAHVDDALKAIFKDQSLSAEVKDGVIRIEAKKSETNRTKKEADQDAIRGRVTDSLGNPIANVSVRIVGSRIGTVTDTNGYYELPPAREGASLSFTIIGYSPITKVIDSPQINVVLSLTNMALDEVQVVNTGYQSLPKERATGSFSFIDNKLLNQRVSTHILDRLEGNVPGLIFNKNTTASSDGGIDINIRGHSTLFANDQPLIVLDNFPYDGSLSNINPNDIENITILKDAASASIWGVKAGNGVIVITSKKGSLEKPLQIEVNSNITLGNKPDLFYKPAERILATDRVDLETALYQQGYYNDKLTSSSYPAVPLTVSILDKIEKGSLSETDGRNILEGLRKNDVRNDLEKHFYQNTVNQQYAINFRGGGRSSDYYLSAGYDNNRSSSVGFENDRLNMISTLNLYPTNKLKVSAGVTLTYTKRKANTILSDLNTLMLSGLLPEYTDLVDDETKQSLEVIRNYNPAYLESLNDEGFMDWFYRPYSELSYADNIEKQLHNRINLGFNYKVITGLSASLKYQYEKGVTESTDFRSLETYYTRNLINRFYDPDGSKKYPVPNDGGILLENRSNLESHRGRIQLDYENNWKNNHSITALLGTEISQAITASRGNTLYGYNPENANFTNVDYTITYPTNPEGAQLLPNNISVGKYNDRYLSYFANASYSYMNRYILSASGRIDKSNLFGVKTNQKAAPLYSVGFAWSISEEDFWNADLVPHSKFRVTYGYNGNIDKSVSAFNTFLSLSNSRYYGLPYAAIETPGNDQLRWEKVRTINLGYDFSIRNNRLSGSVEFYFKKGVDLFGYSPLPSSTGFTAFYGNTASVSTKGFDIFLNSMNISSKSFQWTTNAIVSRALDIVTDYQIEALPISYISGIRSSIVQPLVGKPLFAVYSYPWAGLSAENGDPQGYLEGQISNDWTAIISGTTVDNMVYNGSARPVHFGALRNTFTYKELSISANILYKLGYYFRRNSINYAALYAGSLAHSDYYKRWQNPGDESITSIPSLQSLPTSTSRESFYSYSEVLIEKGDHIRLQDITLAYDYKFKKNISLKSMQFYGTVNNIGILWKANDHGIDPDVYADALPNVRLYSLGAKFLF